MTLPPGPALQELSREELIAIIMRLADDVRRLEAEVERLKKPLPLGVGPRAYAALATVLNTAKRKGENVFQKLVSLMGKPILHYLNPSIA